MKPENILYPVQYLRAVAALAVFYFHFVVILGEENATSKAMPIEQIGAAGVDLFFVISGFIMAMIAWNGSFKPLTFLRNRLVRVAPLYWTVTLVVFAIALFAPTLLGSTMADVVQLFHSLLFVPNGLDAKSSVPTLIVGWTLNYEMFFYVLVAVFGGVFKDRFQLSTIAFICVLVVIGLFLKPANGYLKFYLNPIILEFAMGILVFHGWRSTLGRIPTAVSASLLALSLVAIVVSFNRNPGELRTLYWGMPAALLLFASLHFIKIKSEWLRSLGDWSYSIYLIHLFIIMGVVKIIAPALQPYTIPLPLLIVLVTAVLIASSAALYRWFEQPITAALKSRTSPQNSNS
jgi:peptidoglycan/LPS O-acetylase OafA/YrhL